MLKLELQERLHQQKL